VYHVTTLHPTLHALFHFPFEIAMVEL